MSEPTREAFKPIVVQSPANHPFMFKLRCLIDLQLGSIVKELRPDLAKITGNVLDVGAGQSPWRDWLPSTARYQGIDVGYADEFGMNNDHSDIIYYDGKEMPLSEASFDCVLCIEVLEHAEDPQLLVSEIARVIKPQGVLLLSVPWSARQHHLPHDYHRFTQERLKILFAQNGFCDIDIRERGNDIGAIANKLTALTVRLLSPCAMLTYLWRLPLGLLCGVLAVCFIVAAHVSVALKWGSAQDPLGYFVRAKRLGKPHDK
ncbi:hypothetical protein FACS1894154_09840 [Betaproteobacteria bacterium]|nr:hypothetical protein FACS1894154_09840 [Betaproteobacteria bacterium]